MHTDRKRAPGTILEYHPNPDEDRLSRKLMKRDEWFAVWRHESFETRIFWDSEFHAAYLSATGRFKHHFVSERLSM